MSVYMVERDLKGIAMEDLAGAQKAAIAGAAVTVVTAVIGVVAATVAVATGAIVAASGMLAAYTLFEAMKQAKREGDLKKQQAAEARRAARKKRQGPRE